MREFNLAKAKQGKAVCTRLGRPARIICFDRVDELPILALIKRNDGTEAEGSYDINGIYYGMNGSENEYDLVMSSEKRVMYSNIYYDEDDEEYFNGYELYNSLEEIIAVNKKEDDNTVVAIARVEWED